MRSNQDSSLLDLFMLAITIGILILVMPAMDRTPSFSYEFETPNCRTNGVITFSDTHTIDIIRCSGSDKKHYTSVAMIAAYEPDRWRYNISVQTNTDKQSEPKEILSSTEMFYDKSIFLKDDDRGISVSFQRVLEP